MKDLLLKLLAVFMFIFVLAVGGCQLMADLGIWAYILNKP